MFDTIDYTSTLADEHFPTRLQIAASGWGRLSLGSNRASRDRPVGLFQQPLPAALVQRLEQRVSASDFGAAPTQPTLVPDETYRSIRVSTRDRQPLVKQVGEALPAPAPFVQAERTLEEAVEFLQRFPQLAIGLILQPLPARIPVGRPLPLMLRLRNHGSMPFSFELPAKWGLKATHCELRALRNDLPPADLRSEHQAFAQVTGAALRGMEPAHAGELAELRPTEQLGMSFEVPVGWSPGRHGVELSLSLALFDRERKSLFVGGLVSVVQTVEVVAR